MTRFRKYALRVTILILVTAVTAGAVIYSYHWRGRFAVGGEWLIPAIVVAVWFFGKELKRLWKFMEETDQ